MSEPRHPDIVVIGVGNPLMGDDGVGIAALSRLRTEWWLDPPPELVDGGTWGMNLLPVIESARRLLLLDAIDAGQVPGSVVELEAEEIPKFLAGKLSTHQIDLREVLAVAELRGTIPAELVAIGVQPERVEMRTGLSPRVAAGVPELMDRALRRLASWGVRATRTDREVEAGA